MKALEKRLRKKRTDVLTPAQRSYCMSKIKRADTKPELLLRSIVWRMGLRYFVRSKIGGNPDLVFSSARVAVFVDGCQWHCCPEHWVRPKSNTLFWDTKFKKNRIRDAKVNKLLRDEGWQVLRFWEHDVQKKPHAIALRIARAVKVQQTKSAGNKTAASVDPLSVLRME